MTITRRDDGWYIDMGDDTYSGPFATSWDADDAIEKILRGDVDDVPAPTEV